ATLGLITIYLPLCDGKGRQVSFGIAEELMRLSVSRGAEEELPPCWTGEGSAGERETHRCRCRFNAQMFACLAEQLLLSSGVDILYGVQLSGTIMNGSALEAVICTQRTGAEEAYAAWGFVDASGDASVFCLAGLETREYAPRNRLASWYYSSEEGKSRLHALGSAPLPGERVEGGFTGLSARELSRAMTDARARILEHFLAQDNYSDAHNLSALPMIPQVRMSRRIEGLATLRLADAFRHSDESVGMMSNWREAGPVYELPLGALKGKADNLYAAGRCISCDDEMWDIARVIPCCAVSGEAAGIAAHLGADVDAVQAELAGRAIPLHVSQLK
ncbi:MAG: FAD-dependent oxidoreductase, partial [Clostridia bacterium]|nr:FAD-dependent oxidoreductase [Clostridia bacterium]